VSRTVKTPERVAEAKRLRYVEGKTLDEVAVLLGVHRQTVLRWTDDGFAERARAQSRAQKEAYRGECEDCGAPTNGSAGPGKASRRCLVCSVEFQRAEAMWTPERLITEAHRWRTLVGRWPVSTDWVAGSGPRTVAPGHRAAMLEFRALTGPWPAHRSVTDRYGSWPAFMRAVGGEAPGTNKGVRHGDRERELRAAIARLADGIAA
jgi:hypothetical protein